MYAYLADCHPFVGANQELLIFISELYSIVQMVANSSQICRSFLRVLIRFEKPPCLFFDPFTRGRTLGCFHFGDKYLYPDFCVSTRCNFSLRKEIAGSFGNCLLNFLRN